MCLFFDERDGERSSVCYSPLTGPWWRHKIWEIVRLGGLIKNKKKTKMKKAQLSWINMLVQIGGEILATLCSNDSTQNLLKLALILPFWILEGFYNPRVTLLIFHQQFSSQLNFGVWTDFMLLILNVSVNPISEVTLLYSVLYYLSSCRCAVFRPM